MCALGGRTEGYGRHYITLSPRSHLKRPVFGMGTLLFVTKSCVPCGAKTYSRWWVAAGSKP